MPAANDLDASAITKLRADLEREIKSGSSTEEIEEWLDAYYAGRRHLVEVIRTYIADRERA